MGVPFTPIIDLLNAVICGVCSFLLFRSFQREQGRLVLKFFAQGYAALVVSYLFFSIPRLTASDNSFLLGIGFVFAQAFLYLAVAFFSKVTTYFINVQLVQRVFWFVIILSTVAVLSSVVFFGYPVHDPETSITDWNIHPLVSALSITVFAGVLLPSAIFFLRQGIRSRDTIVKRRSTVISIGLFALIITAYTYYTATTQIGALISDFLSLVSFLIIFFGVIYKRGSSRQWRPY